MTKQLEGKQCKQVNFVFANKTENSKCYSSSSSAFFPTLLAPISNCADPFAQQHYCISHEDFSLAYFCLLILYLRFWNQIFIWADVNPISAASCFLSLPVKYLRRSNSRVSPPTCFGLKTTRRLTATEGLSDRSWMQRLPWLRSVFAFTENEWRDFSSSFLWT